MKLQRLLTASTLGLSLAVLPLSALAADTLPTPTATPEAVTKLSATVQAQRLSTLKTRGAAEIDRRLASLQAALTRLQASTKLTASDKSTLVSQVQAEITGLGTLKAKLVADTTLADARTDVQSIFTDYRVYALMLPKVGMVAALDQFATVDDKLIKLESDLMVKVAAAKAAGQDVTAAQAALDDMKAKLTDAATQLSDLVPKIINLTPTDYNASHSVLVQYRANLKAARADFTAARTDATTVIAALKSSPAASASPAH